MTEPVKAGKQPIRLTFVDGSETVILVKPDWLYGEMPANKWICVGDMWINCAHIITAKPYVEPEVF